MLLGLALSGGPYAKRSLLMSKSSPIAGLGCWTEHISWPDVQPSTSFFPPVFSLIDPRNTHPANIGLHKSGIDAGPRPDSALFVSCLACAYHRRWAALLPHGGAKPSLHVTSRHAGFGWESHQPVSHCRRQQSPRMEAADDVTAFTDPLGAPGKRRSLPWVDEERTKSVWIPSAWNLDGTVLRRPGFAACLLGALPQPSGTPDSPMLPPDATEGWGGRRIQWIPIVLPGAMGPRSRWKTLLDREKRRGLALRFAQVHLAASLSDWKQTCN
jgi:hypothetical protein